MFPDFLDGARVLEYTDKGHFGFLTDYDENDTPTEKEIRYLAVCKYEEKRYGHESDYYIFSCDKDYNVLIDSCFHTIKICKTCHEFSENAVWHKK